MLNLNWESAQPDDKNALPNNKGEFFRLIVEEAGKFAGKVSFESTPIVWDGIIRICGRDGWLYSFA